MLVRVERKKKEILNLKVLSKDCEKEQAELEELETRYEMLKTQKINEPKPNLIDSINLETTGQIGGTSR